MKKLLISVLLTMESLAGFSQIKISELPTATSNGDSVWIAVVEAGVTKKLRGYKFNQGSSIPGGMNTQVQYNNSGAFGGISGATTNGTVLTLSQPVINVGSDADGDIYYRQSGQLTRLPIGSSGQALRVVSGFPAWRDTVAGGGGSGTVTDFSAGDLSPLFTTTESNTTTTPALSFALSNTSQYKIFGRKASGSGAPSYLDADSSLITDLHSESYYNTKYLAVGSYVPTSRTISTTSPLSGGGDLSTNRTLTIADAAADGSTKGAASFTAADFDATAGNISIDYTNGQAASGSVKGFLASADWTTFNNKQSAITFGTGVQSALGNNIGSAGAPVVFNGAGGTPSSMTGTNISGTASALNIGGNAATATILATTRSIYGNNFDGSAALTQIIASTYGGTGNGFTKFSGPATSEKTFTLPNASSTILTDNAAVTIAQGGTNNGSLSVTNGQLVYTDGSKLVSLAAPGGAGKHLISTGAATFAWSDTATAGAGSGVTSIGTINSQTKATDGAVITGTSLVMQTADNSKPGLATSNQTISTIGTSVDGMGSVITTGSKGFITIPYDCTLTNWYVACSSSGSIQFDIKRSGTSIIGGGGNKPLVSSAQSGNAAISGWTSVAVTAGDILEWVIDSASTVVNCSCSVKGYKN